MPALRQSQQQPLTEVPTLRIEHLTETQKRAYILADNKLAELASWDKELLTLELGDLSVLEFDVETTGFTTAEIDLLLDTPAPKTNPDDVIPELEAEAVSRRGDLWQLGDHRLLCGDSTQAADYALLLGNEQAQMVFTDPPYNVKIDGHVCGLGSVKHEEFVMASGEMSQEQFTEFLGSICQNIAKHLIPAGIAYLCMDWRHITELLAGAQPHLSAPKQLCVWKKDNAGMGAFYRSQHELVFVFKNGEGKHINNFELGQTGRYRTNVWEYAGVNTLRPGRMDELALHPTVKPTALVADAIRDCSRRGGIVLDPFMGSGTTIIAAERCGRRAFGLELSPKYVDVAIRRWEQRTDKVAYLAGTEKNFEEVRKERTTKQTEGGSDE